MLTPRSDEQPLVLFKLGPRLSAMHLANGNGNGNGALSADAMTSPRAAAAAGASCPVGRFIVAWDRFLAAPPAMDRADAHLLQLQRPLEHQHQHQHLVPFVLSDLVQCAAEAFAYAPLAGTSTSASAAAGESALLTVQGRCFNALLCDPSLSPSPSPSPSQSQSQSHTSPLPPAAGVCDAGATPTGELCLAKELIRGLERTDMLRAVRAFLASGPSHARELLGSLVATPRDRGRARGRGLELQLQDVARCSSQRQTATGAHTLAEEQAQSTCGCRQMLTDAHMLSALLLAWPYDQIAARNPRASAELTTAQALERLVDAQLLSASCALLNELRQLRTQLTVLLYNCSSSA